MLNIACISIQIESNANGEIHMGRLTWEYLVKC